jgi:hypothetical protein
MGMEWSPRDRSSTMVRSRVEARRWSTAEPAIIDRKHRCRVARYRGPLSSQPASRRVWADAGRADASAAGPSCSGNYHFNIVATTAKRRAASFGWLLRLGLFRLALARTMLRPAFGRRSNGRLEPLPAIGPQFNIRTLLWSLLGRFL